MTIGEDIALSETSARLFFPGPTFTSPFHSDVARVLGINHAHTPNLLVKLHIFFEDLAPDQGTLCQLTATPAALWCRPAGGQPFFETTRYSRATAPRGRELLHEFRRNTVNVPRSGSYLCRGIFMVTNLILSSVATL